MREIKFRGRGKENCNWYYGLLIKLDNGYAIQPDDDFRRYIDPETVGQFTGMHYKDGTEIYDGDIISFRYVDNERDALDKYVVVEGIAVCDFDDGSFRFRCVTGDFYCSPARTIWALDNLKINYELIGNIHDNPELLEEKHQ